jgi:hypothetical protein
MSDQPKRSRWKPQTKGVVYLRGIPGRVKELFKATCARRNRNMTEVTVELWRMYIEDPTIVKPRKAKVEDYLPRGMDFTVEAEDDGD